MSDDPRTIRILLEKAQFDLSVAVFQLGELQAALAVKHKQLADAQTTMGRFATAVTLS